MNYEYRIVNCLGHLNMATAINDIIGEEEGWKVHSFQASDVEDVQVGLNIETIRVTRFIILFERPGPGIGPLLGPKAV